MQWFRTLLARLFSRKNKRWDSLDYGKPSAAGDDLRDRNNV
jgi:hypothetical protein